LRAADARQLHPFQVKPPLPGSIITRSLLLVCQVSPACNHAGLTWVILAMEGL
jgi:hypothetical protein